MHQGIFFKRVKNRTAAGIKNPAAGNSPLALDGRPCGCSAAIEHEEDRQYANEAGSKIGEVALQHTIEASGSDNDEGRAESQVGKCG